MSDQDLRTLSYDELAKMKSQAIEEMNFESAREIELTIRAKRKDDAMDALEAKKEEVEKEIEAVYQEYLDDCKATEEAAEQRRLSIRLKVDQSFQEWRATHMAELMVIEKEYALEIIRAKERPVKEQRMLHIQAKTFAKMNKFDDSIALREHAKEVFEKEMVTRRLEIDEKYDKARAQALAHQKSDLEILKGKLASLLRLVDKEQKDQLDAHERKFLVAIRSIQQKAALSSTTAVKESADKKEMSDAMNTFVVEKVEEITGLTLSQCVIPITSPKKAPRSPAKTQRTPQL